MSETTKHTDEGRVMRTETPMSKMLDEVEAAADAVIAERDRLERANAALVAENEAMADCVKYYAAMDGPTGWPARNLLETLSRSQP